MLANSGNSMIDGVKRRWPLIHRTLTATLIIMFILIGTGLLTDDGTVLVAVLYLLTAIGAGWAFQHGWAIGCQRYLEIHGTYCKPSMRKLEACGQFGLIYGGVTFLCSLLLGLSMDAWSSFLIVVLDVTSCVGFSLYFGEQLGWDDAEVVGIQQQHSL